jgi:hypothetical protein
MNVWLYGKGRLPIPNIPTWVLAVALVVIYRMFTTRCCLVLLGLAVLCILEQASRAVQGDPLTLDWLKDLFAISNPTGMSPSCTPVNVQLTISEEG